MESYDRGGTSLEAQRSELTFDLATDKSDQSYTHRFQAKNAAWAEGTFINPFERGEIGPDLFGAACYMRGHLVANSCIGTTLLF